MGYKTRPRPRPKKKRDPGNKRWRDVMTRGWRRPCHARVATQKHSGVLEEEFENIRHIDIQFLGPASILFHGFQVPVVWRIQIRPFRGILEIRRPSSSLLTSVSSNNWPRANLEPSGACTGHSYPSTASTTRRNHSPRRGYRAWGPIRGPYRQDSCGARCSPGYDSYHREARKVK